MKKLRVWKQVLPILLVICIFMSCVGNAAAEEPAGAANACRLRVNMVGDIVITNSEGETLEIARETGKSSGTMEVYDSDYIVTTGIPFAWLSVPFSESFTFSISTDTGDISFYVDFGDWNIEIWGVGIEEVTFNRKGEVLSTGTNQKICLTDCGRLSDPEARCTIEGRGHISTSTIRAVYEEESCYVASGIPGYYYITQYGNLDDGDGYVPVHSGEYVVDPPEEYQDPSYTDVPRDEWFQWPIYKMRNLGIMGGTGHDKFSPQKRLTEAETLEIFYNLEDRPYVWLYGNPANPAGGFQDAWYGNAVFSQGHLFEAFAGEEGGDFQPNRPITREKFITVLHHYEGFPEAIATFDRFYDGNQVSDFAQDALSWAVEEDIVVGKRIGILDPQGTLTRAEAASLLQHYFYWKKKTTGEERF